MILCKHRWQRTYRDLDYLKSFPISMMRFAAVVLQIVALAPCLWVRYRSREQSLDVVKCVGVFFAHGQQCSLEKYHTVSRTR